ncbi:MAG: hypothetical protein VX589_04020 [Myxococcota bacterium]|nr:hypothetical protein [Myxococcota bacterium]
MNSFRQWQHAHFGQRARVKDGIIQDFHAPEEEYARTVEEAGLIDLGHREMLQISGPDTLSFLDRLLTYRIRALQIRQGCRPFLLDARGRIRAAFMCLRRDENICWLDVAEGYGGLLVDALDHFHFGERITFEHVGAQGRLIHITGPKASDTLAAVGLPAPESTFEFAVGRDDILVGRVPRSGRACWDIWLPATNQGLWWDRLEQAGATATGILVAEALRIHAGQPSFPGEFSEHVTPLDCQGMDGVTDGKGCYPGQEVIERTIALGRPARKLVQLTASRDLMVGSDIYSDGVKVGRITSVTHLGAHATTALAIVKRRTAVDGTLSTGDGIGLTGGIKIGED